MNQTFLVITSIASQDHPVLKQYAQESALHEVPFIVIGDTKSPETFDLEGCDFYSVDRQQTQDLELAKILPLKHYARKNIGYLLAMSKGADVIIETDDDNYPFLDFWNDRLREVSAHVIENVGWVNVYEYFTEVHIWPRGFALEKVQSKPPSLSIKTVITCPIQQGLADENPDVDALYRLTMPLPINFNKSENIALGINSICPFNSQNTTWFKEAFLLLYLPSYCSFRMTDIWRSFIAERIAWTCGWHILFHQSTVRQDRNDHNLMKDFQDEIPGYTNNLQICEELNLLELQQGVEHIPDNMVRCYKKLIECGFIGQEEMELLLAWIQDAKRFAN